VFENQGFQRQYAGNVSSTANGSKQNFLTNGYVNASSAPDARAQDIIYVIANNPAFQKACDAFGYVRFKWIKITLIPEKWTAATLASSTTLADGEKPELHWVNDDGTFFRDIEDTYSAPSVSSVIKVPVDYARQYSKDQYKSRSFTKDMSFFLKLYQKEPYDSTVNYTSASRWIRTSSANGDGTIMPALPYAQNCRWIPRNNFLYGLTGARSDPLVDNNFKWKEHISWCCVFKEPDFRVPT